MKLKYSGNQDDQERTITRILQGANGCVRYQVNPPDEQGLVLVLGFGHDVLLRAWTVFRNGIVSDEVVADGVLRA